MKRRRRQGTSRNEMDSCHHLHVAGVKDIDIEEEVMDADSNNLWKVKPVALMILEIFEPDSSRRRPQLANEWVGQRN